MKTIKLSKKQSTALNGADKVQHGSLYESRLKVDYGIPNMRMNVDVSNSNNALC